MVISTEPAWGDAVEQFVKEYENAVVYADREQETVLHEGRVRVLGNGWVELPTGRVLSPSAVHHIDSRTG
jgi:hypothetical protein